VSTQSVTPGVRQSVQVEALAILIALA
jgi:hypothetical protein